MTKVSYALLISRSREMKSINSILKGWSVVRFCGGVLGEVYASRLGRGGGVQADTDGRRVGAEEWRYVRWWRR
jgi:hypothetical protein